MPAEARGEGGLEPRLERPRPGVGLEDQVAGGEQRPRRAEPELARERPQVGHHHAPSAAEHDAVEERDPAAQAGASPAGAAALLRKRSRPA